MTKYSVNLFTPVLILAQIILLVISYGNIIPNLPWFVVWFPMLFIGILIVIVIVLGCIAVYFSR